VVIRVLSFKFFHVGKEDESLEISPTFCHLIKFIAVAPENLLVFLAIIVQWLILLFEVVIEVLIWTM